MGFRYQLASTLHDAYSDLGPSHLLIIRILAARRFDFNNNHFFASASATASQSTRTLLRTLPLDHLPASLNQTQFSQALADLAARLLHHPAHTSPAAMAARLERGLTGYAYTDLDAGEAPNEVTATAVFQTLERELTAANASPELCPGRAAALTSLKAAVQAGTLG